MIVCLRVLVVAEVVFFESKLVCLCDYFEVTILGVVLVDKT